MSDTPIHIVVNPAAGHGKAPDFVNTHVTPLLDTVHRPYRVYTTAAPLDAGEIAQRILASLAGLPGDAAVPVIIAGGDGTAHEFIEGLSGDGLKRKWELIILPLGTANALFASLFPPTSAPPTAQSIDVLSKLDGREQPPDEAIYQLSSLLSYLGEDDRGALPLPLPITETTLLPPALNPNAGGAGAGSRTENEVEPRSTEVLRSHVVLSTSLHAQILESSEELRADHPGPERFRLAAQQNVTKFFEASVTLSPASGGAGVEQWDPVRGWREPFTIGRSTRGLNTHVSGNQRATDGEAEQWTIDGPFSYLLSTATCDRLEPTFVISPLTPTKSGSRGSKSSDGPNESSYIYLTVLRPLRDPVYVSTPAEQKGAVWAKRAFEIIGGAYQDGKHVDLTYPLTQGDDAGTGTVTDETAKGAAKDTLEVKGAGEPVVEVFRVGGFDWTPLPSGARGGDAEGYERGEASLVCADGAIHRISPGGKAVVRLSPAQGFFVYGQQQ